MRFQQNYKKSHDYTEIWLRLVRLPSTIRTQAHWTVPANEPRPFIIHKGKKYIDLGSGLNFSENAPRWVPSILTGCVKQIPHLDPELGVLIHSKNREERGKKHIFFTRHVNDAYKEHLKRWLRIPVLQDSYKTGLLFWLSRIPLRRGDSNLHLYFTKSNQNDYELILPHRLE